MQEIWKDIPGYEGYYQVSNHGMVKSLSRYILHKRHGRQKVEERILKPVEKTNKYNQVTLCSNNSNKKSIMVHQLVAMAFLDHIICGHDLVVDHINNIKNDNRLSNLQLITSRENQSKDQWRNNPSSSFIGVSWAKERNKWRSIILIDGIKKHLGYFNSEDEASEYYQQALKSFNEGIEIKVKKPVFSSKYTGVSWDKSKNKWLAQTTINYKQIYLGLFTTELEAHEAYQYYKNHGGRIEAPIKDY